MGIFASYQGNYPQNLFHDVATIANGGTTSSVVDLQGRGVVAIIIPAAFTGTAITFSMSHNNVTFQVCYNTANTALTATVTQGRTYMIAPTDLIGARYLKIISNAAEGAERAISVISRELA